MAYGDDGIQHALFVARWSLDPFVEPGEEVVSVFFMFLLSLICGALIPITLFSSGELVGMTGLSVPGSGGSHSARVMGHGRTLLQLYIWFGWAAYCAWLVLSFSGAAGAGNPWVYYVTGLAVTGAPVACLHIRDRWTSTSDDELVQLQRGANLWLVVLFFGGLTFLVAPQLMVVPYGWMPRVEHHVVGRARPELTRDLEAAQRRLVSPAESPTSTVPAGRQRFSFGALTAGASRQVVGQVEAPSIEGSCDDEQLHNQGVHSNDDPGVTPCAPLAERR